MERKRQNLFLFFEENDDEKDISSNLLHLYMNRFVIAQEEQTEIIGVYNLAKPNENTPMIEFNLQKPFQGSSSQTQFWNGNKTKLEHDQSLFRKLVSEIIKTDVESVEPKKIIFSAIKDINFDIRSDANIRRLNQRLTSFFQMKDNVNSILHNSMKTNHFIIGSSFFVNSSRRRRNFINEMMRNWINGFYQEFFSLSTCFSELESEIHVNDDLHRNRLHHLKFELRRDYPRGWAIIERMEDLFFRELCKSI